MEPTQNDIDALIEQVAELVELQIDDSEKVATAANDDLDLLRATDRWIKPQLPDYGEEWTQRLENLAGVQRGVERARQMLISNQLEAKRKELDSG